MERRNVSLGFTSFKWLWLHSAAPGAPGVERSWRVLLSENGYFSMGKHTQTKSFRLNTGDTAWDTGTRHGSGTRHGDEKGNVPGPTSHVLRAMRLGMS